MNGHMHLLMARTVDRNVEPDRFLVTMTLESHGKIGFATRTWKSETAQPISVSLRGSRYEAMLLLGKKDWIRTDIGLWIVSRNIDRLELVSAGTEAFG